METQPAIMNKQIHILHIAECAGGVERYLQMLLPRLERKGFWQYFICSQSYDRLEYTTSNKYEQYFI